MAFGESRHTESVGGKKGDQKADLMAENSQLNHSTIRNTCLVGSVIILIDFYNSSRSTGAAVRSRGSVKIRKRQEK